MNINDLKDKPYAELVNEIDQLQPVLDAARERYQELQTKSRLLVAARELLSEGLWAGDKVHATKSGVPFFGQVVVSTSLYSPCIQVLMRNGSALGNPEPFFFFDSIEKVES